VTSTRKKKKKKKHPHAIRTRYLFFEHAFVRSDHHIPAPPFGGVGDDGAEMRVHHHLALVFRAEKLMKKNGKKKS
jgi:hypothetical protein